MGNATSIPGIVDQPTAALTKPSLFRLLVAGESVSWVLVSSDAQPYIYNANQDSENKPPEWHLELEGAQDAPDVVINDSMEFQQKHHRCVFFHEGDFWALAFPDVQSFSAFSQKYNKTLFENMYRVEKTEDNELQIFGDAFMPRMDVEKEDSKMAWVEDMDIDQPTEEELRTPERKGLKDSTPGKIQTIAMGANERSYVLRETGIDVLRNTMGGVVDTGVDFTFDAPRGAVSTPKNMTMSLRSKISTPRSITPGSATPLKTILMNSETKMNILEIGATSIHHGDLETGKIVRELSFLKDGAEVPMEDMTTDSKTAQLEDHNTFLGIDKNRLARWDVRDPSGLVQQMDSPSTLTYVTGKDYSRGTNFTCMATSGDGFVVVGSKDGKVRLYSDKSLKQAKTSIPGLGAPITSVAVTYDGRWVLATTDHYLMVVKTTYKDSNGKDMCGFTSRMGSKAPSPRLLRVNPIDAVKVGFAPLEKGHFTWVTSGREQERWVVATCGNYTALWNFRQVKIADPETTTSGPMGLTTIHAHQIVPRQEHIVDSLFMHERYRPATTGIREDAMVVVTDTQVYSTAEDA